MLKNLWNDTQGGIISTELVLVASLVAAGILGGMSKFSQNISDEFSELGNVVSTRNVNIESNINRLQSNLSGTEFYLNESLLQIEELNSSDEPVQ